MNQYECFIEHHGSRKIALRRARAYFGFYGQNVRSKNVFRSAIPARLHDWSQMLQESAGCLQILEVSHEQRYREQGSHEQGCWSCSHQSRPQSTEGCGGRNIRMVHAMLGTHLPSNLPACVIAVMSDAREQVVLNLCSEAKCDVEPKV